MRFPGFEDEWIKTKVGDIMQFQNGKAHESNISENGQFIVVNSKFISTEGKVKKFTDAQICPLYKDEIVMVMSDVPNGKALAKCYLIEENKKYTLNQRICSLRSENNYNLFLIYLINRNGYYLSLDSGIVQTNLRKEEVLNCPLTIPKSISEQQKIASFLSLVDEQISTQNKIIEELKSLILGLKQQLFNQKLRFKDNVGKIFPNWQKKRLRNITRIVDGTHQTPNYVNNGIPFYSVENVTADDFINTKFISKDVFEKEKRRVRIEQGDILMTRIGDIGTVKHIYWKANASFYVSLALIKQSGEFDSKYLAHYIQAEEFQRELWNKTIHVAFPKKINLGEIGECYVTLPTLEEQAHISNFLSSISEKIKTEKSILEQYKKQKSFFLQKLFM